MNSRRIRESLCPKRETGVVNFLDNENTKEFDGRGITIAILDTGVDPAVDGLRVTSTGDPKVIERYDCSGAGDVNTSVLADLKEEDIDEKSVFVTGLSGRKFRLPKEWFILSNGEDYDEDQRKQIKIHLGLKPMYELYSPSIVTRVQTKRKETFWDPIHRVISAETNNKKGESNDISVSSAVSVSVNNNVKKSAAGGEKDGKAENGEIDSTSTSTVKKNSEVITPMLEKLEKEEIECQVEMLNNLEKSYKSLRNDVLLDCILFKKKKIVREKEEYEEWWSVLMVSTDYVNNNDANAMSKKPPKSDLKVDSFIDLTELQKHDYNTGNGILCLEEYKFLQNFGILTKEDQVTISINVWDDGKKLEIVSLCGSHGTHVAAISAGYFPEEPILNGVAPGAQIISLTIGDCRLDSMETGTAISRACAFLMKNSHRIHIVNMSYGEHASWVNNGRIANELIKDVIDKFGVIWVTSGGNHGPALSTISTPAWISSNNVIAVGAYVSPTMMASEYSLKDIPPTNATNGLPYTWTSRGPTLDGDLGISVCAPGGAITSVPNFTLRGAQLMNGTSMASPHVAGCLALLLSGAKQKGFKWTPYSVKRAIENSASGNSSPRSINELNGQVKYDSNFDDSMNDEDENESYIQQEPEQEELVSIDPFGQGFGLIKVIRAFESLEMLSSTQEKNVRFIITCTPVGGWTQKPYQISMRGIYIRESNQNYYDTLSPAGLKSKTHQKEFTVGVEPYFFKDHQIDPLEKINFRMALALVASDPEWVKVPKYLDLANMKKNFGVKIDLNYLDQKYERGGVIYSKIMAYDLKDVRNKGPIFCVHVTVVRPYHFSSTSTITTSSTSFSDELVLSNNSIARPNQLNLKNPYNPYVYSSKSYKPGEIRRGFFTVPQGASWAVLTLKLDELLLTQNISNLRSKDGLVSGILNLSIDDNEITSGESKNSSMFIIHAMSLLPGQSCVAEEYEKMITLNNCSINNGEDGGGVNNEVNLYFKVVENRVLELAISRNWSEPYNVLAILSSKLKFRSLKITPENINISTADSFQKVIVSNYSPDVTEEIQPSASLKNQVLLLRALDMKIVSFYSSRDTIDDNESKKIVHELRATYQFSVHVKNAEATVNCTLLSSTLYENEFESQLWMLFDSHKRYVSSGDAFPNRWSTGKLEKGDYYLRLSIRHQDRDGLERFFTTSSSNGNGGSVWGSESQAPTLPVIISFKLSSPISLDIYQNQYELQNFWKKSKNNGKNGSGGNYTGDIDNENSEEAQKSCSFSLKKSSAHHFFISNLISDKSLKSLPGGPMLVSSTSTNCPLYLQGVLTVSKDENGKKILNYPLKVFVPSSELSSTSIQKLALAATGTVTGKSKSGSSQSATTIANGSISPNDSLVGSPTSKTVNSNDSVTTLTNGTTNSASSSEANIKQQLEDDLRDIKINWVSKIFKQDGLSNVSKCKISREMYEELCEAYPKHLPLHLMWLNVLESHLSLAVENNLKEEVLIEVVNVCDLIISLVNSTELLVYFGTKTSIAQQKTEAANNSDNSSNSSPVGKTVPLKVKMEKKKSSLIEAYVKKGLAIMEIKQLNKDEELTNSDQEIFTGKLDELCIELQKYVDLSSTSDSRCIEFSIEYARVRCKHPGRALKLLWKQFNDSCETIGGVGKWTKDLDKKILELFQTLKWNHAVWLWEDSSRLRNIQQFREF